MSTAKYLFCLDFDWNMFDTGIKIPKTEENPDGMNVPIAIGLSIKEVFGQAGVRAYEAVGGFKNQAPLEVIHQMFATEWREQMIANAQKFLEENFHLLQGLVPEGKGFPLTAESAITEQVAAELMVRVKLKFLMDEIGGSTPEGIWPPPCKGFIEFWQYLHKVKDLLEIETAIITSGHDEFIKKVFAVYGLPFADFMMSEDDSRGIPGLSVEHAVKPGLFPLSMIAQAWIAKILEGESLNENELRQIQTLLLLEDPKFEMFKQIIEYAVETGLHMVHFGDDPRKDGLMAERAGIPFIHYIPEGKTFDFPYSANLRMESWLAMIKFLEDNEGHLLEGRPFTKMNGLTFAVEGDYAWRNKESKL